MRAKGENNTAYDVAAQVEKNERNPKKVKDTVKSELLTARYLWHSIRRWYLYHSIRRWYLYHRIRREAYVGPIRKGLGLKPILPYIEFHLTDHCNLNCKACAHFSPFAEQWYLDIAQHDKDLEKLSNAFKTIMLIRLLGGEPLLHPRIMDVITHTRKYFPNSRMCIVTNGILLPTMPNEFWETCRQNKVDFNISIYPPFFDNEQEWAETLTKNGLQVHVHKYPMFYQLINTKGNSTITKTDFRRCRSRLYCPCLEMEKYIIAPCPPSHITTTKHTTPAFHIQDTSIYMTNRLTAGPF